MMRVSVLALVVAFGAGFVQAQAPAAPAKGMAKAAKTEAKAAKAVKAAAMKFAGMAESVDAATGKLSLKDTAGKTMAFTIGADVKIMKGTKKAALADVMAGDSVAVTYEGTAEAPVVKSVKVSAPKKAKAEKAAKK